MPEPTTVESGKGFAALAYLDDFGGPNFLIRHEDGRMELVSSGDGYSQGTPLPAPEDYDLLLSQHGYLPCKASTNFKTPEELRSWVATGAYRNAL